ncbi:hypothetical protein HID58_023317 [Brassica napus]|uniref:Uncharacterized protein n=1 Tax=Brassica napus TaxID=3708 RepID=A0ABQ8D1T7_BRANA|nr:hypothetical protein HID58_023317 [Brassica napus]
MYFLTVEIGAGRDFSPRHESPGVDKEKASRPKRVIGENVEKYSSHNDFGKRVDRHGRRYGERISTRHTRNPPPLKEQVSPHQMYARRSHHEPQDKAEYYSPQYTKQRRHHPYESSRRGPLFPQRDVREWRVKQSLDTRQKESTPTSTRQAPAPPVPQEQTLQNLDVNLQNQTREEIMEQLQEYTRQYLSCEDPTEAAARRIRVLAGDARGEMEETEATNQYLSCTDPNEAAARRQRVIEGEASGEVEETVAAIMASSSLPVIHPSHNEVIMGNDPSEAMIEAHNQDTRRIEEKGRETPRRRRMKPATTRSSAGSPNILRGASSKKRNLSSLWNLPARRSRAEQAVEGINIMLSDAWKDMNQELMRPHSCPFPLLMRIFNLCRVVDVFYRYQDCYTHPEFLKEHIVSLFIEDIPI